MDRIIHAQQSKKKLLESLCGTVIIISSIKNFKTIFPIITCAAHKENKHYKHELFTENGVILQTLARWLSHRQILWLQPQGGVKASRSR